MCSLGRNCQLDWPSVKIFVNCLSFFVTKTRFNLPFAFMVQKFCKKKKTSPFLYNLRAYLLCNFNCCKERYFLVLVPSTFGSFFFTFAPAFFLKHVLNVGHLVTLTVFSKAILCIASILHCFTISSICAGISFFILLCDK